MTTQSTERRSLQRERAIILAIFGALFASCILCAEGTKMARTVHRPYHSNEGMIDVIRISRSETCRCPCQEKEQQP